MITAYSKDATHQDIAYATNLYNELKLIRSKSGHSIAQSLSTKINDRYDNSKALITAIHDALQRGVSVSTLGELFARNYTVLGTSRGYGGVMPKYKEYMDRQKAINTIWK